ncbi:MAG: proteasome accessory factor PafA2 family protein [bacterium]
MARCLMGMETEYAVSGTDNQGSPLPPELLAARLLDLARSQLPHLPDEATGIFLGNGSRLYVDHGNHPELSGPECSDPREVIRYLEAGDRIIRDLAAALVKRDAAMDQVNVFKGNIAYGNGGTSWGCHESFLLPRSLLEFVQELIPHLVTRILYSGAGGFDPTSPGLQFSCSPRVHLLGNTSIAGAPRVRGLYQVKRIPASDAISRRLHVTCGESLHSQLSTFLKVGTTALILALLGGGDRPGGQIALANPLDAMSRLATHPDPDTGLELVGGESATALEIQHYYLELVEHQLESPALPGWAENVCMLWRQVLRRFQESPESLDVQLDWRIKRALYGERIVSSGFDWHRLDVFNGLLEQNRDGSGPRPPSSELSRLLTLRRELFELDMRFNQLGDEGVFQGLDQAGVLAHKLPGIADIRDAAFKPPAGSRAEIRGTVVQRLAGKSSDITCSWDRIRDDSRERMLDLADPFESQEKWEYVPAADFGGESAQYDFLDLLRDRGL